METFLWSLLPFNELISLQPDSSPLKCSNIKNCQNAHFQIEITTKTVVFRSTMSVCKHFRPKNSKSSQFTSYSLSDAGHLENFARRHGKVVKKRSDGLIVVVARKQHDVGFYVKGGKKYYTRYYTTIWSNFGRKLETLHPGFPTRTIKPAKTVI